MEFSACVRGRTSGLRVAVLICLFFLGSTCTLAAPATDDSARFIVRFKDPAEGSTGPTARQLATSSWGPMQQVSTLVAGEGGRVRHEFPQLNAVAVDLRLEQRERLLANPEVVAVEVDPPRYMLAQQTPYGIPLVQADQVSYGPGPGIKVCVVDSGFDLGHPDLPGPSRVTGQAAPNVGNWFEDGTGHGTHVAGTIMALANNEGVIGATNGGDFDVHIYKVFPDESEPVSSSDVIAGVQACVDAGARVVNLSLGCTGDGCFSAAERDAFAGFAAAGVLIVAAAGNEGLDLVNGTLPSYPAGYDSVIAVAAVDESLQRADFSQRYAEVELAAPGVAVQSTVPRGTGFGADLTVLLQDFASNLLEASPAGNVTGELVDCGIADSVCTDVAGAICLIERGVVLFVDKARNCQSGGGLGAVVYNNVPGSFLGTLGEASNVNIPVLGVSDADGAVLLGLLGEQADLSAGPRDYGIRSGTSMATPHVAGVAALVWSQYPTQTNHQIRAALQAGALDLGSLGRDPQFGFGLVQAGQAVAQLSMDSDGDGMSDAYETAHSLDPLLEDGLGDRDSDGFSNLAEFYASSSSSDATSIPLNDVSDALVAAVLPASRSARVGNSVTAFATLINASQSPGINCSIAPIQPLVSNFEFFATDAATNAISGPANRARNLAAGEVANFVLRFTPSAAFSPAEVRLRLGCENLGTGVVIDGLNTLLLSASSAPVADVVALAATPSADGVLRTAPGGAGAFSVATVNLGAPTDITVTAQVTNTGVPVALSLCDTDLAGRCLQPAASSIITRAATLATPTFSVFAQVGQITAFDPATTRIRVTFADAQGQVRGATSVAISRDQ